MDLFRGLLKAANAPIPHNCVCVSALSQFFSLLWARCKGSLSQRRLSIVLVSHALIIAWVGQSPISETSSLCVNENRTLLPKRGIAKDKFMYMLRAGTFQTYIRHSPSYEKELAMWPIALLIARIDLVGPPGKLWPFPASLCPYLLKSHAEPNGVLSKVKEVPVSGSS